MRQEMYSSLCENEKVEGDNMIELIIECLTDLIISDGADTVSGSERTKGWSKKTKIAVVVAAILLVIAVTGVLVGCGVAYLRSGDQETGLILLLAGIGFLIVTIIRFRSVYVSVRKNNGGN